MQNEASNPELKDCSVPLWVKKIMKCFYEYLSDTQCFIFIREKIKYCIRNKKTNPTSDEEVQFIYPIDHLYGFGCWNNK